MGNSRSGPAPANGSAAPIHAFYSNDSWIEGAAVDQLNHVAALEGVRHVAAFPDLHPGKYGPVGCAILADRVYPQLIGNDIGCGMSLFALDIPARKLNPDKAAEKLRALDGGFDGDSGEHLEANGLPTDLFAASLGTIGGGNHFCELQAIHEIFDEAANFAKEQALLLVHSGSRAFGMQVFEEAQADGGEALLAGSPLLDAYLTRHSQAVRWASLNRHIIALRAARALRGECELIADSPHNIVEAQGSLFLHRKGAAKADLPLVPLAGSRDALSFILRPSGTDSDALSSLAHGAGRKYDRSSMPGRAGRTKSEREQLVRTSFGGRVVCEDRQLLIEEAPSAYKNPEQVVQDLQDFGLAAPIASLRPVVTFKRTAAEGGQRARPTSSKDWRATR
jgi:release factor H-coupled RctB family protein